MIEAGGLQLPQKSLTTAIDQGGIYYRVPMSCINDPGEYGKNLAYDLMKSKKEPVDTQLNVKIRRSGGDTKMILSNKMKIIEVKTMYLKQIDAEEPVENMRLFCLGKELKDELFVYSYDIMNDQVMQAQVKPLLKD